MDCTCKQLAELVAELIEQGRVDTHAHDESEIDVAPVLWGMIEEIRGKFEEENSAEQNN